MSYLENETATKLQAACVSIMKACAVYEISEMLKLGLLTKAEAEGRLKVSGIRPGTSFKEGLP